MKYIYIILAIAFTLSCKKKKEEVQPEIIPVINNEQPNYQHIVVISKIRTLTTSAISLVIKNGVPSLAPLLTKMTYDVDIYKVRYKTKYKSDSVVASGIICVPRSGSKLIPTLSFHHGTLFSINEVPSNNYLQQVQVSAMASSGYFTVAPDYLGFDAEATFLHPFYNVKYSIAAVRDMLVAGKEFSAIYNLKLNKQLFLAGYSQGGNVTMAAMKNIESNPVSDFELTASAAGAGGYNMVENFKIITAKDTFQSPNYLAYIIQSYRTSNDWTTPLTSYFKEPFASQIPNLFNKMKNGAEINKNLTIKIDSLLQKEFISSVVNGTNTEFIDALKANSLYDWKPTTPLRLYHGDKDEIVPYADSDSTYKHMLKMGSTSVTFFPLPGQDHASGVYPMVSDVLIWFDRLVK